MLSMAYLANLRPTKGFWNVKKEETFHFLILFQVCLSRLLTKNYFKISFWVLCVPSIPANIGAWAEQAATKSVILIVSVFLTLSINPRMCHESVLFSDVDNPAWGLSIAFGNISSDWTFVNLVLQK